MFKKLIFALGLAIVGLTIVTADNTNVNAVAKDCIIPIGSRSNYIAQWPLVFDQNGKFYKTLTTNEELEIAIKSEEEVTLSCGPNYFKKHTPTEVLKVRCNGETGDFTLNGLEQKANELTCDLRVIEEILGTVYGCVDSKWTATRFGYVDPSTKKTILLGEACYDTMEGKTRFVHIKMGDESSSHLEVLPKNYLTSNRHPDGRYKIEMFRGLNFDEIYDRIRNTLHTRQAPFLKMAHFIEEPFLPNMQFQAIKKLGWNYFVGYDENEMLESLKVSIKLLSEKLNLDIYTGSHGIKQLHGNNDETMEIYLHETSKKRFPMPNLIWFVVQHKDAVGKGIAFAVPNDENGFNASIETDNPIKSICKENICSKVTWLSADLKQSNKLICCDVNDFRQIITEVPALGDIKEILI